MERNTFKTAEPTQHFMFPQSNQPFAGVTGQSALKLIAVQITKVFLENQRGLEASGTSRMRRGRLVGAGGDTVGRARYLARQEIWSTWWRTEKLTGESL